MTSSPVENLQGYDCVLIVTDHSHYDYAKIVAESQLVVDTRNATKDISRQRSCAAEESASGRHEELLEQKGLYYAMWRQQVGERAATKLHAGAR